MQSNQQGMYNLSVPWGEPVSCGHIDTDETQWVCTHLLAQGTERDYYTWFVGEGMTNLLVCEDCKKHINVGEAPIPLQRLCSQCVEKLRDTNEWVGIVGQPTSMMRSTQLSLQTVLVQMTLPGRIVAIQPLPQQHESVWLAITEAGDVLMLDLVSHQVRSLFPLPISQLDLAKSLTLLIAPNGRFATLANTREQHGLVVDLQSGQLTMPLMRDKYHIEHSDFSLAFAEVDGQLLLIHATEWNRLDFSDPHTGKLLSVRPTPMVNRDHSRQPHYLDYFHCSLAVSPDAQWIVDAGWAWTPAGIPRAWSLPRWVTDNVWESEDGSSLKSLTQRWSYYNYDWDLPMCWLDNEHIAIWGYGIYDAVLSAAVIYNARTGAEVRWFPGPSGAFIFDTYLFTLSPQEGLTGWDVTQGERVLSAPHFHPTHYHPGAKQFLQINDTTGEMKLGWIME